MKSILTSLLLGCALLPPVSLSPAAEAGRKLVIHPIVTDKAGEVFDHWEHPDGHPFSVPTAHTAQRGAVLAAVVLFEGCSADKEGNCNVDLDIRTVDPTGKTYGEMKGADLWQGKRAPSPGYSQLGHAYMGLRIEPHDPLGTYKVLVIAHDRNAGTTVQAETTFKVK